MEVFILDLDYFILIFCPGTQRVALDWLFDRINLDSKIQIKYVDTRNQLADILTKGNFTRDEWNHLLRLFNISNFQLCSVSSNDVEKNSRRNRRRKDRGKVKTDDELCFADCSKLFHSAEFDYVEQPGDTQSIQSELDSTSRYLWEGGLAAEDSNKNGATSSSQAWQSDVEPNPRARRPASHGNKPRLGSFSTRGKTCG